LYFTFFLLLSTVHSYGPLSHYSFACQAIQGLSFINASLIDYTSLYIGSDLPDGMWNGWFMSGSGCPTPANQLHSPIYAGYMIREALTNPKYSGKPEFYSFAIGYATHPISDQVGFSAQGGYLGNVSSIIEWSTKWIHMLSLDALIYQSRSSYPFVTQCQANNMNLPTQPLNSAGLEFMADALAVYHTAHPTSPIYNSTQLKLCSDPWGPSVNTMNEYAKKMLVDTTVNNLLLFDLNGAINLPEIQLELSTSFSCIMKSLQFYLREIILSNSTPESSWQLTAQYITQLFNQGECTTEDRRIEV